MRLKNRLELNPCSLSSLTRLSDEDIKNKEDQKLAKIKNRLKRAKAKETSQQRKDLGRLKIILGAVVLEHMKADNLEYYLGKVSERDKEFVQKTLQLYREKKS